MSALNGGVVAIAGAGGGAGPAVAARLAAAGATVAVADASAERAEAVAARVRAEGGTAEAVAVDLLDADATDAWAADLVGRHGRVDGLVHLVGGWRGGKPLVERTDDWDELVGPLVVTVQHTSRAFHDALRAAPAGRFVLVSSKEATRPSQTNAGYAAAKAAAETWTLALAAAFTGSPAAATILVVTALLTPAMREKKPDATFAGFTPVDELAERIETLWGQPGESVNGSRVWLTERP